ncbi:hypothetical protein Afil01_46350 [Actinorhabdospora filicis]|uniref:Uncharacterized protein n=1 Tax=Actinorhabdospora filicis TaxID=1785913 RepID=A0A9W6SPN2_9ACTN|nr:hypothetical protein Afil01_46350 [Actinorhabdospora filicis]
MSFMSILPSGRAPLSLREWLPDTTGKDADSGPLTWTMLDHDRNALAMHVSVHRMCVSARPAAERARHGKNPAAPPLRDRRWDDGVRRPGRDARGESEYRSRTRRPAGGDG